VVLPRELDRQLCLANAAKSMQYLYHLKVARSQPGQEHPLEPCHLCRLVHERAHSWDASAATCEIYSYGFRSFDQGAHLHLYVMLHKAHFILLEQHNEVYLRCQEGELVANLSIRVSTVLLVA